MIAGVAPARRRAAAHVLVGDVAAPEFDGPASHHVLRVLRIRDGQPITVTDGAGRWRSCRLVGGSPVPEGEIVDEPRRALPITIAVTIPKADRPEWVVQKLTELGIDRIVLMHAARSIVRWERERGERHIARLAAVAAEALQQSRGVWLPELVGPVSALDVLPGAVAAEPGGRPMTADDRVIAIGPEGGWSDEELAAAADTVALAGNVLRVETAAVVAATAALHAHR